MPFVNGLSGSKAHEEHSHHVVCPAELVHRFSCPSPGGVTCLFTVTYGSLRCTYSQLLSEADLPENHGCPNVFLRHHWSRHVKSAMLHVFRPAPRHLTGEARLCPHVGVGRNAPKPQTLIMGQPGARIELTVTFEAERRHLPIVTLRRVA